MQKQLQEPNVLQLADLQSFGSATGPCVSLYFADHDPGEKTRQDVVRLNNAIDHAERHLRERGFDKRAIDELMDPVRGIADDLGTWLIEGNAFAIFRSPDVFRIFRPMHKVDEIAVVGEHFYVMPILGMLNADRFFYVLAVSQKNIRLLRCTDHSSEEVELPAVMPRGLDDWLNTRLPNESAGHERDRGEPGSTQGAFTSATDRDRKDEHILNFFRVVDRHVADTLRNQRAPLVLAGVESMVALFGRIVTYQYVAEEAVYGSPDGLKGGELHARALPIAEKFFKHPLEKALRDFEELGHTDRRAIGADSCVRAAYQSRVSNLFVAERSRAMGTFNPDTLEVKLDPSSETPSLNSEDLLNFAVLQTLLHAGDVWLVPPDRLPGGTNQIAAVLRF